MTPSLLAAGGGSDFIGPADFAKQVRDAYTAKHYHKPSDELRPDWDFSGGIEDLLICFQVGFEVANAAKYPEWKPGTEFKATREAQVEGSGFRVQGSVTSPRQLPPPTSRGTHDPSEP